MHHWSPADTERQHYLGSGERWEESAGLVERASQCNIGFP
jgi:hypothetical protein